MVNRLYICLASSLSGRRVFRLGCSIVTGSDKPLQNQKLVQRLEKNLCPPQPISEEPQYHLVAMHTPLLLPQILRKGFHIRTFWSPKSTSDWLVSQSWRETKHTPSLLLILTNTSSRKGQLLSPVPREKARAQSCASGLFSLTEGPVWLLLRQSFVPAQLPSSQLPSQDARHMVAGGGKNTIVPASAPLSLSQDGGRSFSATSFSLAMAQKPGGQSTTPTGAGSVTSVIFRWLLFCLF